MAHNKSRNTECEVLLCKELRRLGLRFKRNVDTLPGTPDIVFFENRVAIFCDGDFWHGRDWKGRRPRLLRGANAGYWVAKIEANIARDLKLRRALRRDGGALRHHANDNFRHGLVRRVAERRLSSALETLRKPKRVGIG